MASFFTKTYSQVNWATISSSRGNFSFQFPQGSFSLDTLGLLTYINTPNSLDSSISFQVNFIDSVAITGNDELVNYFARKKARLTNPKRDVVGVDPIEIEPIEEDCYVDSIENILTTYAQMYAYTTSGTIEGFINSNFIDCFIRGKELTIKHPDLLNGTEENYFAFCRYFFWNGKFLVFTISGPESRIWELYSYKNQFFGSINIY